MRRARVLVHNRAAGVLEEIEKARRYRFVYDQEYDGPAVSLTMATGQREHSFEGFPPFFDGLLPEGVQLESLIRLRKVDRDDLFAQLLAVGSDLVGAVTVEALD